MSRIAIVYHSGYGHNAALAAAVAEGVSAVPGASADLLRIEGADQDFAPLLKDIEGADAVIFGSPTYMGTVSAPFKAFMDASSKPWSEARWANKLAAGFTISASWSGDKLNTLQTLAVFAAQHGMLWVSVGLPPGNNNSKGSHEDLNRVGSFLGVMAQANADQGAEVAPPPSDKKTAAHLGQRVAEAALRWKRGA